MPFAEQKSDHELGSGRLVMVSVHHKLWSSPGAQFGAHVAAQSMLQAPLMDDMDQSFSKAPKNSYIKHSLESTKKQSPREAMSRSKNEHPPNF